MVGLLYKDFVSMKGKKLCCSLFAFLVILTALRVAFPGYRELSDFMLTNEHGEAVNLIDAFFCMVPMFYLIMVLGFINSMVSKIVEDDQKNKIMNYVGSMPFGKHTYIAAKYVFIVILAYVAFSFYSIISIICKAFCGAGPFQDLVEASDLFALLFVMLVIFSASIELPLFLCLGYGKAMIIKVFFWLLLGFLVIGYLFFGNLSVITDFDYSVVLDFVREHTEILMIGQVLSVVVVAVIYYLSYRITCFFKAKEVA